MNLQIKGPVINYGEESYKTGGGASFTPTKRGGGGESFSHAGGGWEGRGTESFEVVLRRAT